MGSACAHVLDCVVSQSLWQAVCGWEVITAGLSFGTAFNVYQSWHYGEHEINCARREYTLALHELEIAGKSIQVDVLNAVREELRDQVVIITAGLENLLVSGTLFLTLGFGFVCEGTFPPQISDSDRAQHPVLVAYAIFCALVMVFPLWTVIFVLRIRLEVDGLLKDNINDAKMYLKEVIENNDIFVPQHSDGADILPEPENIQESLRSWQRVTANYLQDEQSRKDIRRIDSVADNLTVKVTDILQWRQKEVLRQAKHYNFYYPLAQMFLFFGMLSAVILCCLLMYLVFLDEFPITSFWMTPVYASTAGLNAFLSVIFVVSVLMKRRQRPASLLGPTGDIQGNPSRAASPS